MIKISNKIKSIILIVCFGLSCYGFLLKLPAPFRKIDSELHALFFFVAAAFLNILFRIKKTYNHFFIFGMLFLFGAFIEFAQDYSNKIWHEKIHGNFDPQDLKYNLFGLLVFSLFWFTYYLWVQIYKPKPKSIDNQF